MVHNDNFFEELYKQTTGMCNENNIEFIQECENPQKRVQKIPKNLKCSLSCLVWNLMM